MPSKYQRKSLRATRYTKEDLETAVNKVRNKELTNYAASQIYGIPTSTLHDRVRGRTGILSHTLGRPPAIPMEMEARLANCLRILEKWGWGLSKEEVLDLTSSFIKQNGLQTPFNNDRPGDAWFLEFRKRHNLSVKTPQPVEYLRKRMTDPFIIYEYFNLLKNELTGLDSKRIWNLDESSITLDPTKTKVVGGVGLPCTRTTAGTGKEHVTVLTTVNAAGEKLNPLIVFKGKNVYEQWMADRNPEHDFELSYAASKKGWMEKDIFFNYMEKVVIPNLGQERPVLIIYDGHVSHVDEKVITLAAAHDVTILKLPPHTSHLLQPLDLAVFKSFKSLWDKKLVTWQRQNVGSKIRKQVFAEMFAEAWHATKSDVIRNGFKKGGIEPFNPNVIPKEKFDPAAYKRWQTHNSKQNVIQPKTLKQLCTDNINRSLFSTCLASEKPNNCTESSTTQSNPDKKTFEELLLENFKQKPNNKTNKLTKVAKGGEVITRTYLNKQKDMELKIAQDKATQQLTADHQIPGSSGTTKVLNRKRKIESDKIKDNAPVDEKEKSNKKQGKVKSSKNNNKNSKTDTTKIKTPSLKEVDVESSKLLDLELDAIIQDLSSFDDGIIEYQDYETIHEPFDHETKKLTTDTTLKKYIEKLRPKKENKTNRTPNVVKNFEVGQEIETEAEEVILDETTGFLRRVIVTTALVEKPKSYDLTFDGSLFEFNNHSAGNKENVSNTIMSNQQEIHSNPIRIMNKKRQKKKQKLTKKSRSSSTTSEDIVMSIYSDSDLDGIEIKDDIESIEDNVEDDDATIRKKNNEREDAIFAEIMRLCENFTEEPENNDLSRDNEKKRDDVVTIDKKYEKTLLVQKTGNTNEFKNEENDTEAKEIINYQVGDTVLTRYCLKNNWKYYVGVVTEIKYRETEKIYGITYYRTINKNKNVKFVKPKKRCDYDDISVELIVKEIELIQIKEHPEEYVLNNDEDLVYF
ncbi:uncharacterized protein LOC126375862 [Pectinophora gossypiella]|uniref:uncharacterized protein LOC126375862 n=1 Tax=Pectinophora gossypiella TaxID=13191 RepID=UPI00214E2F14|nr:uncharacterized protein LOC126375862 [Pectinophora gossypiella]